MEYFANKVKLIHTYKLASGLISSSLIQIDQLETCLESKAKPIGITMAVREKTREIIWFDVAKIAAKGKLKTLAASLYSWNVNESKQSFEKVISRVNWILKPVATIKTDQYPAYNKWIRDNVTSIVHHKSLKIPHHKAGKPKPFDPMFSLNRVAANLRKNLASFARRTTIIAKKQEMIEARLWIFLGFNNKYDFI